MPILVKNIRFYQKSSHGHMLETPIQSINISQLEGDLVGFLRKNGYIANTKVCKRSLEISNIRSIKTGIRATPDKYARLRSIIATGLEQRNMIGDVTGGN